MNNEDTRICIPTLNEESGIAEVISAFQDVGYRRITVIDGGSTDGTKEAADKQGAEVIPQQGDGKGAAVKQVFDHTSEEIIVLVDGDATYTASDTDRIVQPIREGNCDHVLANRFGNMKQGAMSRLHRFGNRMINQFFSVLFGQNVVDVLTGFRAIRRSSYEELKLESNGFDIEVEMTAGSVKAGQTVCTVPTSYKPRNGDSNLNPVTDGIKILYRACQVKKRP